MKKMILSIMVCVTTLAITGSSREEEIKHESITFECQIKVVQRH